MRKVTKTTYGFAHVVLIIIVSVISIFVISLYLNKNDKLPRESILPEIQKALNKETPTPTPHPGQRPSGPEAFPFQDLTIPYLRSQKYESNLGELEKVSENANYTSYFTNYDSGGYRINGLLTIPKEGGLASPKQSEGGWPAVIFVHGYIPPEEYQTLINYTSYVDFLARNGLVIFKIDLRGHADSEGDASGAYYSGDYVIDILNAHAALKQLKDPSIVNSQMLIVDPEKIGLWGHSMAGNVVFRSFVAKPDIKKVVIWAGAGYTYSDLQEFRIQDNSYRPPPANTERARKRAELRNLYGDFNPDSEFWKQVPGTNYLSGVNGEVQIHHASDDNVVSIDYSRNLMSILDNTEIPHELFEYSSGGHNLVGNSFTQAMQRSADFFRE